MIKQLNLNHFETWRDNANVQPALPLVIDVREPWEMQTASVTANGFELLHVPMQNIPVHIDELKNTYGTDHPTALLCHHGMRSMQVANFLAHHGFTNLVNLQGGIDAWSHQVDASVARY
jgi:rhodanese-related sulfurtransferase